jgi:hypothetical protein
MSEPTPTLRYQIFAMLSNYRLCDILQTIDDTLERTAPKRTGEHNAVVTEIQLQLSEVIESAEKIEHISIE